MLKNYIFEFSDKTYRKIRGTAIGTKFARLYAILFTVALDEKILSEVKKKPSCWWRCIGNLFSIWKHIKSLKEFIKKINSCHPYHCKKDIPYSHTLRLNRICSDNSNFDKRYDELES